MKVSRGYIGLIVIFIAGIVLGVVGSHFCRMPPFWMHPHSPPPPPSKEMLLEHLSRDLSLSETQIKQVQPSVFKLDEKLSELRRETEPKIQAIIQSSVKEVEPFLTESQREELHKIASRFPPTRP